MGDGESAEGGRGEMLEYKLVLGTEVDGEEAIFEGEASELALVIIDKELGQVRSISAGEDGQEVDADGLFEMWVNWARILRNRDDISEPFERFCETVIDEYEEQLVQGKERS